MKRHRGLMLFCGIWLCTVAPAYLNAQTVHARDLPATTKIVEVELSACESADIESVRVVLDGDESAPILVKPTEMGGLWRGQASGETFDARGRVASVRYKGGRTLCAQSEAVRLESNRNQWAARFAFTCLDEEVWGSLRVEPGPGTFPIAYVRDVDAPWTRRKQVPCREKGSRRGSVRIAEIASMSEAIYLHFSEPGDRLYHEFYHLRVRDGEVARKKIDAKGTTVRNTEIVADWSSRSRGAQNEADILRKVLDKKLQSVTLKKEE